MTTGCLALVGTGPLPDLLMYQAGMALSHETGRPLVSHGIGESPNVVLSSCADSTCLLRLNGDAGRLHPYGGSWLSALADWRLPVLLLTPGESDGGVTGAAAAWVALCHQLGVPLIGITQLRGTWQPQARRRDGLPGAAGYRIPAPPASGRRHRAGQRDPQPSAHGVVQSGSFSSA